MTSASGTRRQWWLVLALMGSVAAAALLAPRLERRTLRVALHQGVEGVALRAIAREFSSRRQVDVELFELPYNELYDAEMRAVAASRAPYDVIMLDDPWLPALIGEDPVNVSTRVRQLEFTSEQCAAHGLEDFVATTLRVSLHPNSAMVRSRNGDALAYSCQNIREALYALPFVGNSQLFVTRRDLRPRSWHEVQEITGRVDSPDAGYVARVGAGNSFVTDFLPILWTLSTTADTVSPASAADSAADAESLTLERTTTLAAFDFIHALGKHPRANRSVVSVDDFDLAVNLVKQNASMSIAWSAWVMAIAKLPPPYGRRLLRDSGSERLTISQVPGGEPVLGAWLLAVPAQSAEAELAREFLTFATRPDQIIAAARLGNPPPRKSAFDNGELVDLYPFFDEQLKSLSRARPRTRTPLWRDFEQVLGECLTTLYENATTPAEAWNRVSTGLEPILAKQRRIRDEQEKRGGNPTEVRRILDEPLPQFSCVPEPPSAFSSR